MTGVFTTKYIANTYQCDRITPPPSPHEALTFRCWRRVVANIVPYHPSLDHASLSRLVSLDVAGLTGVATTFTMIDGVETLQNIHRSEGRGGKLQRHRKQRQQKQKLSNRADSRSQSMYPIRVCGLAHQIAIANEGVPVDNECRRVQIVEPTTRGGGGHFRIAPSSKFQRGGFKMHYVFPRHKSTFDPDHHSLLWREPTH